MRQRGRERERERERDRKANEFSSSLLTHMIGHNQKSDEMCTQV